MADDSSLRVYIRGRIYWVKGVRPDTGEYIRQSLGTSDAGVAETKIAEITKAARQRRLLGADAPKPEDEITFAGCVLLYDGAEREKKYLIPIVRRIGKLRRKEITPQTVRKLAKDMMPWASTDTWQREVLSPVRSVINNAHELGRCAPIRIKAFAKAEMVKQDLFRGRQSRVPRTPGSWPWLLAFMKHAEPRDAALAYFMFRHGYRVSQCIAMTRSEDMDLTAARVRVHASKGHPAHWVDLDTEEVVMISNLPVPYRGQARDRVFTIAGGRSGALYRRWAKACAAAEIEYLPPHSCGRHGYGTEMTVRQKVDPISAAENLWSDPSVMLKTYSHSEEAATKVRDAFRAGRDAARTPAVQAESPEEVNAVNNNAKLA